MPDILEDYCLTCGLKNAHNVCHLCAQVDILDDSCSTCGLNIAHNVCHQCAEVESLGESSLFS